ncbi:alpha/beta hydrolase [Actinocrinis puniceicyclus]|uniref:Alpha/beta hydrolase n=1 Tax=Actinocrinis puniceicyclus TaxID=977794 RepID=A0A8J7WL01_9ACTN|nr:alpha/beta hydrolase [Actinocrinis puniceicyclus]MBS2963243.1 alpha/beta hydrolase [Actinocrinis puniceicyclus]
MTQALITKDGRRLTVEQWGDPRGHPVFLLHGTPGSRVGPRPRGAVLYRRGIRLLAYDRPGYGGSDRHAGRAVADAAADVEAVADALGVERFAVVGRSGGGPHALACAALLPHRVTRAAVLVGIAPRNAAGLEWHAGMTPANRHAYAIADTGADRLAEWYEVKAAAARANPASMLDFLDPQLPEADRRVVSDFGIKSMLASNFAEAFRESAAGWTDDTLAFIAPWGFDLSQIEAPVLLWHGTQDVFAPIGHSRWLAERIRHVAFIASHGAAHFGAVAVLPRVLSWLAVGALQPGESERGRWTGL